MKGRIALPLGAAFLATQLVVVPAMAQNCGTSRRATTGRMNPAATGQRVRESRLASQMLERVKDAREAIRNGDRQSALAYLNKALNAANNLQVIAAARGQNIVPIYAELEQVSVIGPIQEAKATGPGTVQAQAGVSTDNTGQIAPSGGVSTEAAQPGPAVEQAVGDYTFFGVDLPQTVSHIQAAKIALENNNLSAANSALLAAQQGVMLETVATDLPLLRARQNLALAEAEVNRRQYAQAVNPLQQAAQALGNFRQAAASTARADEAAQLQQQIQNLSQNIQVNPTAASAQINTYWRDVNDLMTSRG